MTPARGRLLVRPVEVAETFAGGRIVVPHATRERLTMHQVEVIAVGAFAECDPTRSRVERKCTREHMYVCEDATCNGFCDDPGRRVHAHPVRAGDWVLIAPRSTIAGPTPERAEYFVHQDDVLGIFNTEPTS